VRGARATARQHDGKWWVTLDVPVEDAERLF
jgi:hypothetical protein